MRISIPVGFALAAFCACVAPPPPHPDDNHHEAVGEGEGEGEGDGDVASPLPPTCVARIKSVNGISLTVGAAPPPLAPLDDVVVSLDQSTPAAPAGSIASFHWDIVAKPPQSQVVLSAPTASDTGFLFDAGGVHAGIDFSGAYELSAIVEDDLGVESVNDCGLTLDLRDRRSFHVELSWDTADNDLDLHLIKRAPDGRFCVANTAGDTPAGLASDACDDGLDCDYATCRPDAADGPDWDEDGVPHSAGDPALDVDDIGGFGPENASVDAMRPGDVLIGINEYQGTSVGPAAAEVQIFFAGTLAATFVVDMDVGAWKEVALVHFVDGAEPCLEDLTDGNAHDQCG